MALVFNVKVLRLRSGRVWENLDLLVGWLGKNAYQMIVKHDDEPHGESNL